ncbi:toll/interleukin-1 receptor domain-containing protein [Sphingomonas sp. ID1715]|uniref:tetratricopeptide repeat protein n=1 Tax=Sphingomonas sp. ID1715 TaxID=1656898 RepID=UPI00148875B6|nr:tetratricopeptide repeat protein [Sphingomonas sp. ID1715]NNM78619.1 toll/interleukin-1 receptor domain-containing protein [Sphingomonas sp. ID1715]
MRYSAFISYNFGDRGWARWLHRRLESYSIPTRLRGHPTAMGPLGNKLLPVFRDRDELGASSDLAQAVQDALVEAHYLIVICSPRGAKSRWVDEEIRSFVRLGRAQRIMYFVVDGEPHDPDPAKECFPPAVREGLVSEPLAADIRPGQDPRRDAVLKLLSRMLEVPFDALRQREVARRQRRLALVAAGSTAGLLLTTALAIFAFVSRAEAIRQRDIAQRKTVTAERTVEFVKSLFEVSDPSEARGETITAREILDKGARDIRSTLTNEPAVKAELGTTLGEVYAGLGLFRESDTLIREMMGLRHGDRMTRTRQYLAMADSHARTGRYDQAIASYGRALEMARDPSQPRPDLIPRILVSMGEAESAIGNHRAAAAAIKQGLRLDLAAVGDRDPAVARDLESLGLNAFNEGDLDEAQASFTKAIAIRYRRQGATHPRVAEDYNTLGAIAYLQGNAQLAEESYRKALRSYQLVLGPDHPEVANTSNNLARLLLERRRYGQALPLLERAVAINLKEKGPEHDDFVFPSYNLALVKEQLGALAEAQQLLRQSLRAARYHRHRNLGPILTDLAALRCRVGAFEESSALLDEAAPIMKQTYPTEAWRTAWVDNTRGYCAARHGDAGRARQLLQDTTPIILARWRPDTHFGVIARSRLAALSGRK